MDVYGLKLKYGWDFRGDFNRLFVIYLFKLRRFCHLKSFQ